MYVWLYVCVHSFMYVCVHLYGCALYVGAYVRMGIRIGLNTGLLDNLWNIVNMPITIILFRVSTRVLNWE